MQQTKATPLSAAEFDYQKSLKKTGDNLVNRSFRINRYLNRPLASLLVKAFFPTRVTPNQLTVASFLIGVASAVFFAKGERHALLLGGILAMISNIVDCADGMLARSKNLSSRYGAFLDLFLDRINEYLMFIGLCVGLYVTGRSFFMILVCIFATSLYFLAETLHYLTLNYNPGEKVADTNELRAVLIFLIFVFTALNRVDLGFWVLLGSSTILILFNVVRLIGERERRREI